MLRDGDSGDWIGTFLGHKGAVWSARVDTRSRTLCATGSGDFTAKLWCVSSGKELVELRHRHIVRSVDFSADTEQLATGCQDGILRIFRTADPEKEPLELSSGSKESIIKVAWADGSSVLVLGRRSGRIEMYDTRIADPLVHSKDLEAASVMDLEVNPSHGFFLAACGKTVHFVGLSDLSVSRQFVMPDAMHFKEEGGVTLHPSGERFMAGASDLWLREFDAVSGAVLNVFKGHHGPIRCVRYHPVGKVVASGSEDGTIRLWDIPERAVAEEPGQG